MQEPQYLLQDAGGVNLAGWYVDANGDLRFHNHGAAADVLGITTGGAIDALSNPIDNRTGYLTGYLTTAQSTMETGKNANVFENLEVNDGPYTKDSASQVTVNRAGRYRISWETGFKQVGGNARATMQSFPQINTTNRDEFRSYCYIRLANGNGDSSSCGNEIALSLASGDSISIHCSELTATGYDHDLRHASVTIEYLG